MQDFWRSSKHTAVTTARLVWNHLFKVLGLFILAMGIFLTACYYWVVFTPTDYYLKYNELAVADVEQGRRAVATVCYEVNERHSAEGEAVFYVANRDGERVYDSKVDFDFTLSGSSPCEQEFIPTQDLEPGVYYLHLIRTIRVQTLVPFTQPVEKKADVAATDTFTVKEKAFSRAEMEVTVGEINKRISELNKKLNQLDDTTPAQPAPQATMRSTQPKQTPVTSAPQPAAMPSTSTPSLEQPRPVIEPQRPSPQPEPTPAPEPQKRQGPVGGVVGGVNDLVIDVLRGVEGVF